MDRILPEDWLAQVVNLLVRVVEIAGAVVIFSGAAVAFAHFCVIVATSRDPKKFNPVRLTLGRFLIVGLEFQLASDLLRTAVAPSYDQIGKLAAVAAIRTGLDYFIGRELAAEEREGVKPSE